MTSSLAPLRVLVAEDDFLIADHISTALEQIGAVVVGPTPDLDHAFRRLAAPSVVELAILDIRLGRELVFPVADALMNEGVPFVFFSGYEDSIIPARFSRAIRVSKSKGVKELIDVVLDHIFRRTAGSDLAGDFAFGVVELIPELRWRARQLVGEPAAADRLVEEVLKAALTQVKRGTWHGSTRYNLNRLLRDVHLCRLRSN